MTIKALLDNKAESKIPTFIIDAFDRARKDGKILAKADGTVTNINLSTIWTLLIQAVGRFVESFASDVLLDIHCVEEFIRQGGNGVGATIFLFGLRESGVDHLSFVARRLADTADATGFMAPSHVYRKIYALYVAINGANTHVELVDIMSSINTRRLGSGDGKPYALVNESVYTADWTESTVLMHAFNQDWLTETLTRGDDDMTKFLEYYFAFDTHHNNLVPRPDIAAARGDSDYKDVAILFPRVLRKGGITFTYNHNTDTLTVYASDAMGVDVIRENARIVGAYEELVENIGHDPAHIECKAV